VPQPIWLDRLQWIEDITLFFKEGRANMGKEAKYVVRLSEEERTRLGELVARGRVAASVRQRANSLCVAEAIM